MDKLCDGINDCENGADESVNVCDAIQCRRDQFRCPNRTSGKLCIDREKVCYDWINVTSTSGQAYGAGYNTYNSNDYGSVHNYDGGYGNGYGSSSYGRCDNGTESSDLVCQDFQCLESEFRCPNKNTVGSLCIKKEKMCDGNHDCNDGADESVSTCSTVQCGVHEFRCPNRTQGKICIGREMVCRGTVMQYGGQNHAHGPYNSYGYQCNGYYSPCFDGAENSDKVCNTFKCRDDEYRCPNRTQR